MTANTQAMARKTMTAVSSEISVNEMSFNSIT